MVVFVLRPSALPALVLSSFAGLRIGFGASCLLGYCSITEPQDFNLTVAVKADQECERVEAFPRAAEGTVGLSAAHVHINKRSEQCPRESCHNAWN